MSMIRHALGRALSFFAPPRPAPPRPAGDGSASPGGLQVSISPGMGCGCDVNYVLWSGCRTLRDVFEYISNSQDVVDHENEPARAVIYNTFPNYRREVTAFVVTLCPVRDISGGSLLPSPHSSPIIHLHYICFTQDIRNAPMTLELRVALDGGDHLLSGGTQENLPFEKLYPPKKLYPCTCSRSGCYLKISERSPVRIWIFNALNDAGLVAVEALDK
ncbi:hypothetical protein EVAR_71099_1 [Eumeta japonica]|uniref:Uncharacterized protein n=1 Tax=Eumeta variegata TaxID=151549 RepID=A0A4C1SBG4_EUMVA|nr:hypothetical protein EVAR_71099_1 [Eumeta japonica]